MLEGILRQQPENGKSLFVDMNSFFASVEQEVNPHLRGRPVGVCPFVSNATVVLASSIEAKRLGVATGTKVVDAKRLCPDIVLVEANPQLYRDYHRRIMADLENLPCHILVKSVDEALLTVPSYLREEGHELARQIKERVAAIGSQLKCSVGVGSNMFLAKMGTNLHKPDGYVEIKTSDLPGLYSVLRLTDLHGIAWRMAKQLRDIGIRSPLDFYRASLPFLRQKFGVNGDAWYLRLRGYEVDLKETTRRMIGHQVTIIPDPAKTKEQVMAVASQLTYRAAIRLRKSGLAAKGITVAARYDRSAQVPHRWWAEVYHGSRPFFDSASFFGHVKRLFQRFPMAGPVRFVSVSAIDLVEQPYVSQALFFDPAREERLSQALDELNFRYGEATVGTAKQLLTKRIHDAIGFGNAAANARELPKGQPT